MIANIFPSFSYSPHTHKPEAWNQKVKFHLFQNIVMLHIKLRGHKEV